MDTIFALSTAAGKAGVAVIRVSGPLAHDAVIAICGDLPAERMASLRALRDTDGDVIDEALVLVFGQDRSFTGECSAELQVHGSPAVVSAVMDRLAQADGLRLAEAGEFTRRALENGRIDLAQVEGLADLIDAETDAQRRQAMRVLSGGLGRKADGWRQALIRAAALLEATIDFADEEVPVDVSPEVMTLVDGVTSELRQEISGVDMAERIRSGFEVAIVGAPNVGKSTLLNRLAGRQAAITSEYAGTTRDVIEVRMDLNGLPVTLLDTAGLRETKDAVESIGIGRARERALAADLRVFLINRGETPEMSVGKDDLVLVAKADLGPDTPNGISGRTGTGVTELIDRIGATLSARASGSGIATRVRHAQAMRRGLLALEAVRQASAAGECSAEIAAEELRSAARALDSLVGRVDIDAVLDEIFASFCLGK